MKPKSREPIFLVGFTTNKILGSKLPSNRQVLSLLFHYTRVERKSLSASANDVISTVNSFWEKANIQTKLKCNSVKKLIELHKEHQYISKKAKTVNDSNYGSSFKDQLDDLFDIAHVDALKLAKSETTRKFLIQQRQTGRPGCLMGMDLKQMTKESRISERLEKEESRKRKHIEAQSKKGNQIISAFILVVHSVFVNIINVSSVSETLFLHERVEITVNLFDSGSLRSTQLNAYKPKYVCCTSVRLSD